MHNLFLRHPVARRFISKAALILAILLLDGSPPPCILVVASLGDLLLLLLPADQSFTLPGTSMRCAFTHRSASDTRSVAIIFPISSV